MMYLLIFVCGFLFVNLMMKYHVHNSMLNWIQEEATQEDLERLMLHSKHEWVRLEAFYLYDFDKAEFSSLKSIFLYANEKEMVKTAYHKIDWESLSTEDLANIFVRIKKQHSDYVHYLIEVFQSKVGCQKHFLNIISQNDYGLIRTLFVDRIDWSKLEQKEIWRALYYGYSLGHAIQYYDWDSASIEDLFYLLKCNNPNANANASYNLIERIDEITEDDLFKFVNNHGYSQSMVQFYEFLFKEKLEEILDMYYKNNLYFSSSIIYDSRKILLDFLPWDKLNKKQLERLMLTRTSQYTHTFINNSVAKKAFEMYDWDNVDEKTLIRLMQSKVNEVSDKASSLFDWDNASIEMLKGLQHSCMERISSKARELLKTDKDRVMEVLLK